MIEKIKDKFIICQKSKSLFQINIEDENLVRTIEYLTHNGFITLSQIACADWIEDDIFTLNYILTTKQRDINLMAKCNISRVNSSISSVKDIFAQSEIMERDLHEMYGIDFIGNETLGDFVLENWNDIPPLRREFDTLKYVNENFDFKNGREDNKDVKAEAKRRRAEAKKRKEVEDGK